MNKHYGLTYSAWQVYGPADMVLRVWSTLPRLPKFCEEIVDDVLEDDKSRLRIFSSASVRYVGHQYKPIPPDLDPLKALIRLDAAQGTDKRSAERATRWLLRKRLYLRRKASSMTGQRIPCFTLLAPRTAGAEETRSTNAILVANRLLEEFGPTSARRLQLCVCLRGYRRVERFDNDHSDMLLTYSSPNFTSASDVAIAIAERLEDKHFRTLTFLATKRLAVDSDLVGPR